MSPPQRAQSRAIALRQPCCALCVPRSPPSARWHTQRCGRSKTPATSTARDADYLLDADYLFGQNMTEHNPAPSPSGHPLLSGQTFNDIPTRYSPPSPPLGIQERAPHRRSHLVARGSLSLSRHGWKRLIFLPAKFEQFCGYIIIYPLPLRGRGVRCYAPVFKGIPRILRDPFHRERSPLTHGSMSTASTPQAPTTATPNLQLERIT